MKKIFITVFVISLLAIIFIIPKMYESKIKTSAPELLRLNGFEIVKEGEFHLFTQEVDYVVTKDNVTDSLKVRLSHGSLTIQPN